MTCSRLLKDQADQVDDFLRKVTSNSHNTEMALFYLDKARNVLDEMQREICWSDRRSGEA